MRTSWFLMLIFTFHFLYGNQPERVTFATADSGRIEADFYTGGERGVVLAHGAIFNKESWAPLAERLAQEDLAVLAINFRGYGKSRAGTKPGALEEDVLAAVAYLHQKGYASVSVLGASMGGGACARAAIHATPGVVDKLILLSPVAVSAPEKMNAGRIFYIASKNEGMALSIKKQFEAAPQPKEIFWINGSAHAQHIFKTDQTEKLTKLIIRLLNQ